MEQRLLSDITTASETIQERIERAIENGWQLGVYGNPVDEDGIYPASVQQAIEAWQDDPSLVYVTHERE